MACVSLLTMSVLPGPAIPASSVLMTHKLNSPFKTPRILQKPTKANNGANTDTLVWQSPKASRQRLTHFKATVEVVKISNGDNQREPRQGTVSASHNNGRHLIWTAEAQECLLRYHQSMLQHLQESTYDFHCPLYTLLTTFLSHCHACSTV
ncbi:uncharacterized protein ARMOST_04655 [Armillaria ostoyae]|uniref:Uncharacterized protein n=1 Tax=Armillaria ostoyae TaxID=47428 RepID=A0A284QY58_ARMOS|nr:uncharacterized protein ARMOST_04655 [Armillaria ostoyae]